MKWTSIPENLAGLSSTELTALGKALQADLKTNLAAATTKDELDECATYKTKRTAIVALAAAAAESEAEEAAEKAAADEQAAAEQAAADEQAAAEQAAADEAAAAEAKAAEEAAAAEAAAKGGTVPTSLSVETTTVVEKSTRPFGGAAQWQATDATPGKEAGEGFANFGEIAVALQERAQHVVGGSDTKHYVAVANARFGEHAKLGDNALLNLDKFEPEVMAAMCAPLQPLYDLACQNTSRRPVANSLPQFQEPRRGGFSVYPSPSLTDITTGYGQWTSADDANPAAVKEACQTIECATPTEYRIYGVYRCLTVKNLLQMTFPELVEAYLNRLAAAQARLAETLLLEAMGNGSVAIDANEVGYNASTSITSTIINYLGLYQEIERWDNGAMDVWLPRWVGHAMQMDQVRRRRTDGGRNIVPSIDEISSQIRETGVEPHWFMDRPTWATPIPPLATNGVLNYFPRNVEMLVAPRGKFGLMDRGQLSIGVAPNNLYRDNTSNSKNEFTLFFENFEGVINTTSCPAHIIQINDLCYNGQQIADVSLTCEGQDYPGIGS